MQNKNLFTGVVILVIVGLLGTIVITSNSFGQKNAVDQVNNQSKSISAENNESEINIFFSANCQFCHEVESWIKKNAIDEKINIKIKEVTFNKEYAKELEQAAISCRINSNQVGVPFLFAHDECYIGKIEIIDYLQKRVELVQEEDQLVKEEINLTQDQEKEQDQEQDQDQEQEQEQEKGLNEEVTQ